MDLKSKFIEWKLMNNECLEKTTSKASRAAYVGMRAMPASPQVPVLYLQLTFISGVK